MAFVTIETTAAQKAASISMSYRVSKNGVGTLFVSIPSALAGKSWDGVDRARVSVGTDEHEGLLALSADATGSFKLGRMRSTLVVRVPRQAPWSNTEFDTQPVEVTRSEPGLYVLRLPKLVTAAPTYFDAVKPAPKSPPDDPRSARSASVSVLPAASRPVVSIIGTTVERGQKRVKLTMPHFNLFQALWKAWGEPVHSNALLVAVKNPDIDLPKVLTSLGVTLSDLGFKIAPLNGGYVLQYVPKVAR
jgi:hypothetical protein